MVEVVGVVVDGTPEAADVVEGCVVEVAGVEDGATDR